MAVIANANERSPVLPPQADQRGKRVSGDRATLIFRHAPWVGSVVALGFVASVSGAVFLASSRGAGWLAVALAALAVLFGLGLADAVLTRVRLTPAALEICSNFRTRVVARSEIGGVTWSAGCPVSVRLATGRWIALPPVGDSSAMANGIRAWLERARQTDEKDSSPAVTVQSPPFEKGGPGGILNPLPV